MDEGDRGVGSRFRNVGGTKGGLGEFLVGLALLIAGGYLFLSHVQVTTGFAAFWGGGPSFGLTLLPIFVGICLLFFNGRSVAGWLLAVGGVIVIFVGVISQLHLYFAATSLYNVLVMLGLLGAGVGLVARSMQSH